jgi:purine-nucleoside phosphorylase
MSNHARGLWGYTGTTPAGQALTVQSTGMGGPSAAIVVEELAELGVRRAIRVGTCGALTEQLGHGDLVVVGEALARDGTSRALGAGEAARPDAELTTRLASAVDAGTAPTRIVTTDLFYDADTNAWRKRGAVGVEMEAATLFTLGSRLGIATACILAVSDTFRDGNRQRIDDDELSDAAQRMGAFAAEALRDSTLS